MAGVSLTVTDGLAAAAAADTCKRSPSPPRARKHTSTSEGEFVAATCKIQRRGFKGFAEDVLAEGQEMNGLFTLTATQF
jgi:hypothetical protein